MWGFDSDPASITDARAAADEHGVTVRFADTRFPGDESQHALAELCRLDGRDERTELRLATDEGQLGRRGARSVLARDPP